MEKRSWRVFLGALFVALILGLLAWALFSLHLGTTPIHLGAVGQKLLLNDPRSLWALLLVPLLLLSLGSSYADLPWQQRVLSVLLRGAFFCSLIFGISRPVEKEKSSRICAVVLVDVSTSMSDASLEKFRAQFSDLFSKKGKEDEIRLLGFAEHASELPLEIDSEGKVMFPTISELRALSAGSSTDVAAALELSSAWTRSDCVGRYHLFSDGIETRQNALSMLNELRSRGVRLSATLLREAPPRDVAVLDVAIAEGVRVGEPFKVRVSLKATSEARGQLRLYQGSTLNGLDASRTIQISEGEHFETFDSVVRSPGDVSYRAEFVAETEDAFSQNNLATSSVEVPGPPRVLLVDRSPDQLSHLAQALSAQQLDVELRAPLAIPGSDAEFAQFQFVILSDLARADLSRGAVELLARYVRSGGGLLYSGGEAGFGPGGWQGSDLEKILPVRMDARKEREVPGVAMALVIDRSGSMTGLPLEMAKEACKATVGVLDPHDLMEVIAFDSKPKRYVKMQPARYRDRITSAVSQIQPGGGTEIFSSLDMAYQDLAAVEARKKHIVLLTDGNAASDGIYELASTAFADGITITTVGLGDGANRALLTMIAEAGGGRFHIAEDPSRLPRIFTRETELISQKASLDDWFPVSVVRGAQFLKGIGITAAPLLRGYTSTQLAPAPAEMILASDRGEPILARRPLGLGWSLAWTSDFKTRWATDWLRWRQFGPFIAQLVREHQKTDDKEIRPMKVEVVGDEVVATLEAYNEREGFDSSLESVLNVRFISGPQAGETKVAQGEQKFVSFSRVAPGLYQARAPLPEFGSYAIKAVHRTRASDGNLRPAGVSFASSARPYPEEFRDLKARPEALKKWAKLGGGQFDPRAEQLFSAQGDAVEFDKGRQNDFIFLALLLFLLDLLVRRVRLFDRNFAKR